MAVAAGGGKLSHTEMNVLKTMLTVIVVFIVFWTATSLSNFLQLFGVSLRKHNNHNHRFTAIIQRSTCVSRHLQLRTVGLVGAKLYCPHAFADGNQHIRIREKTLEFSSAVLSTLSLYRTVSGR